LKFVDESHIVPRKLGNRKVLGLVNKRVYTKDSTLQQASASIFLITILEGYRGRPFFFDYREESNTQWDFLDLVLKACKEGVL
jgi:hypothetical protein